METDSSHPASKAITHLLDSLGGQWPPRPSFVGWPTSWLPYMEIADEMREKNDKLRDTDAFRDWMDKQVKERVNIEQVMDDIEKHLNASDPVFLGLLSPLTYMSNLYRWGQIPTTDEERKRTTLDFPDNLWRPFTKICDYWGFNYRGNTFGFTVANGIYQDPTDPLKPTDLQFTFNYGPENRKTEKNFLLSFLKTECVFSAALSPIKQYLDVTEKAKLSKENAEKFLQTRLDLLNEVKKVVGNLTNVFSKYMKDSMVSQAKWADHVQAMTGWNVNGINGGTSGGEALCFTALDGFLGTRGEGIVYKAGEKKAHSMVKFYRDIIVSLDNGYSYRFESFLGHSPSDDPILSAKDDVIQSLYVWRLAHSKVARPYLVPSKMTSGGSLDNVLKDDETIASRAELELRQRARETIAHTNKK